VWSGIWYSPRNERNSILQEFKTTYHQYASTLQTFICTMHLFLAPLAVTKRILQRIEASIYHHITEQPGIIGAFPDKLIRLLPQRVNEKPLTVVFQQREKLLGMPYSLDA
jgi:hypothetical protein